MNKITKEEMMRLFALVNEANESLKKAQKLLPKDSIISRSIANNEKFLSCQKIFEDNLDSESPKEFKIVVVKKAATTEVGQKDWTTANIQKLKRDQLDYIQ